MAEMIVGGNFLGGPEGQMELVFDQHDDLTAFDLANYLIHFRAVYALALPVFGNEGPSDVAANAPELRDKLATKLGELSAEERFLLFGPEAAGNREILIESITYASPARFTVRGAVGALVAAVILSGGHFELGPLKADLPPIADGIQKLLELIQPNNGG